MMTLSHEIACSTFVKIALLSLQGGVWHFLKREIPRCHKFCPWQLSVSFIFQNKSPRIRLVLFIIRRHSPCACANSLACEFSQLTSLFPEREQGPSSIPSWNCSRDCVSIFVKTCTRYISKNGKVTFHIAEPGNSKACRSHVFKGEAMPPSLPLEDMPHFRRALFELPFLRHSKGKMWQIEYQYSRPHLQYKEFLKRPLGEYLCRTLGR